MAGGSVRIICPNLKCRAILSAPAAARGKNVRCRMCGQKVRIGAAAVKRAPVPVVIEDDDATTPASGNGETADGSSK